MRSNTKTSISYGLHNIPVKICTVIREPGTGLSNSCPHCNGDVGHKNVCKSCDREIAFADIRKALKVGDEKHVFSREQTDSLKALETSIDVVGSVAKSSLDLRLVTGSYYLLPDKKIKAWKIVNNALTTSDKYIAVKYALRGKTRLGLLTPRDDSILLLDIAFNENLVQVDEKYEATISEFETEQGIKFVNSLKEIDLAAIKDEYQEKLETLVKGELLVAPTIRKDEDELSFFKP